MPPEKHPYGNGCVLPNEPAAVLGETDIAVVCNRILELPVPDRFIERPGKEAFVVRPRGRFISPPVGADAPCSLSFAEEEVEYLRIRKLFQYRERDVTVVLMPVVEGEKDASVAVRRGRGTGLEIRHAHVFEAVIRKPLKLLPELLRLNTELVLAESVHPVIHEHEDTRSVDSPPEGDARERGAEGFGG